MHASKSLPVEIAGVGSYLPEAVLTNEDMERMVDTSDEWIVRRTGIKTRHKAAPDQASSDLATESARRALADAGMDAAELDAIIVATCTPDYVLPATACLVQNALGAANAFAYDLEAACSGFVFAYSQAVGMIGSGMARNVLVVAAEVLTRLTDFTDRGSCILFGDGAGAVVLRRAQNGGEFLHCELGADGSQPDILIVPGGGSRRPTSHETVENHDHYIRLAGRDVFRQAVTKLTTLIRDLPVQAGISLDEIKLVVPHQSNMRIIKAACERTGMDPDLAYMNIERVGNTSAASIPIALHDAIAEGRLDRGDIVLFLCFGGGLTWGSLLLRY
jgi:3-oxoacyl-[acyl-carrier-protein] synthase III